MKRICSQCKTHMGEKCGRCGSLNVQPILADFPALYTCLDCGHSWEEGTEMPTHGLCEECLVKVTGDIGRMTGESP